MPRLLVRVILCASSYAPLLLVLAIRSWTTNRLLAGLFLAVAALSCATLVLFLHVHRRAGVQELTVRAAQTRDGDVMGYVATYLVPFAATPFRVATGDVDWTAVASLLVLMSVIVLVYVQANLIYINPLLAVLGYRVFEAESTTSSTRIALIARRHAIAADAAILVTQLAPQLYMETDRE